MKTINKITIKTFKILRKKCEHCGHLQKVKVKNSKCSICNHRFK